LWQQVCEKNGQLAAITLYVPTLNYSAICFDLHSWVLVKLLSSQTHRTAERVTAWRIGRSPLDGGCQSIDHMTICLHMKTKDSNLLYIK
jgi:hypothetical protein